MGNGSVMITLRRPTENRVMRSCVPLLLMITRPRPPPVILLNVNVWKLARWNPIKSLSSLTLNLTVRLWRTVRFKPLIAVVLIKFLIVSGSGFAGSSSLRDQPRVTLITLSFIMTITVIQLETIARVRRFRLRNSRRGGLGTRRCVTGVRNPRHRRSI